MLWRVVAPDGIDPYTGPVQVVIPPNPDPTFEMPPDQDPTVNKIQIPRSGFKLIFALTFFFQYKSFNLIEILYLNICK